MTDLMNKKTEELQMDMVKRVEKELKITRYCTLLVATLLIFVIVGGVYVVNKMTPVLESIQKMQPTIEKMEALDIEVLNEKIDQLDIEGLNKIVEDLDVEALSETLRNINDATAKLKEIQSGLGNFSNSVSDSISDWFGNGNGGL